MNFANLFKIAVKALSNNKLRGFLTMLGIIIGVGVGHHDAGHRTGVRSAASQAEISEMGSNMIMIHPGGDRRGGVQLSADDMESLKLQDLEDIQTKTRLRDLRLAVGQQRRTGHLRGQTTPRRRSTA